MAKNAFFVLKICQKYDFMDISIEFITADLDKNAPDIWNVLVQPTITPTLTNGVLTGVTIDSGGSGWNQYGREPEIIVTDPMIDTGRTAVVEGTFSAGVLTGLTIKDGGAGYTCLLYTSDAARRAI